MIPTALISDYLGWQRAAIVVGMRSAVRRAAPALRMSTGPTAAANEGVPKGKANTKGKVKGTVDVTDEDAVPVRELRAARMEKVSLMRASGTNPYAYTFATTHSSVSFADAYKHLGSFNDF